MSRRNTPSGWNVALFIALLIPAVGCDVGAPPSRGTGPGFPPAPHTSGSTGSGDSSGTGGSSGTGSPSGTGGPSSTSTHDPASGVHVSPNGTISSTGRVGSHTVTTDVRPANLGQQLNGNFQPQSGVTVGTPSGGSIRVENSAPNTGEMLSDLIVTGQVDTRNRTHVTGTDSRGRKVDYTNAYNTGKAIGQIFSGGRK
jgi:hypothetical protein